DGVSASRWSRGGLYSRRFSSFDPVNDQKYYIEIFNKGSEKLQYTLRTKDEWIRLSSEQGTIQFDERVYVDIDWGKAPSGQQEGEVVISGAGQEFSIKVPIRNTGIEAHEFVENNGVVSIDA